jgi:hypothetical protein
MKFENPVPRYPWLNPKLNWESIFEVFQEYGRVVIVDFLSETGLTNFVQEFCRDLDSKKWTSWMAELSQNNLTSGAATLFASRYRPGDFLSEHDDAMGARRVAWTLHLTPTWRPHWGGQLAILDESTNEVVECIGPGLNQLTLFAVPLRHAVLSTSIHAQSDRYAIAGWYNEVSAKR